MYPNQAAVSGPPPPEMQMGVAGGPIPMGEVGGLLHPSQSIAPLVVNFDDPESDSESTTSSPVKKPAQTRVVKESKQFLIDKNEQQNKEFVVKTLEQIRLERIHKESSELYKTPVDVDETWLGTEQIKDDTVPRISDDTVPRRNRKRIIWDLNKSDGGMVLTVKADEPLFERSEDDRPDALAPSSHVVPKRKIIRNSFTAFKKSFETRRKERDGIHESPEVTHTPDFNERKNSKLNFGNSETNGTQRSQHLRVSHPSTEIVCNENFNCNQRSELNLCNSETGNGETKCRSIFEPNLKSDDLPTCETDTAPITKRTRLDSDVRYSTDDCFDSWNLEDDQMDESATAGDDLISTLEEMINS